MRIKEWFLSYKKEFSDFAILTALSRWEEWGGVRSSFGNSLNSGENTSIAILKFFNFWFKFKLNPRICEILGKCFRKYGNIFASEMSHLELFEILFDLSNFKYLNEFSMDNNLWASGDINFTNFCIADWFKNKDNPGTLLPWNEAKSWVYRINQNRDKDKINESVATLTIDSPFGYTPRKLKEAETFLGSLGKIEIGNMKIASSLLEDVPEKFKNDPYQSDAFVGILSMSACSFILIQGGPGTGKTEIGIEALISILRNGISSRCIWLSPTHAARKMAKKRFYKTYASAAFPDMQFKTIHSYANNKEVHRFIFVDELSMVDSILLYKMINKNRTASYIFMGDCNQLMPIDRGTPFYDFIMASASASASTSDSNTRYKVYNLVNNYRSSGADIPRLCSRMLDLDSTIEELIEHVSTNEIKYSSTCDDKAIYACIMKFKRDGYFPDCHASYHNLESVTNFRIIVATNEEVRKYNQIVKKIFWPLRKPLDGFSKDDILVCNVNITNLLYNGDFVLVSKVSRESIIVILNEEIASSNLNTIEHDEIHIYGPYDTRPGTRGTTGIKSKGSKYWIHILDRNKLEISYYVYQRIFTLAYVSTVHKAQGSEQDHVIVLSARNCILHTIQWIYTAISRAKLCIYIFMPEPVINRMILRESLAPVTLLQQLLEENKKITK